MSGHVIYTCQCLNIKIYLANKYHLEGHDKYREAKFVRLENISGWQFELSMKGVTIEYPCLIRIRRQDNDSITTSCQNCTSGDVYSVKRPNMVDTSLPSKFGDQVMIHSGTIFGKEIDVLQKKASYSNAFHIILNPDLPVKHLSLEKEDESFGKELLDQQKHVQKRLKQALIDLEEIAEKRIQAYQQEQELILIREKEKAMHDGNILWQKMKEVSKAEEQQRIKRLSITKTDDSGTTDQLLLQEEEQNDVIRDQPKDAAEQGMLKGESHVHFFCDNGTALENQHRRRSSVVKRDIFAGSHHYTTHRRRSSYVLDESAIANSLKKEHGNHYHPVRRRSSLNAASRNHHVHPLAPTSKQQQTPSNTSSSWEDDDEYDKVTADDGDSEDMFALDEDIDHVNERRLSNRKGSVKYIQIDEEYEEIDNKPEGDILEEENTNQVAANFATSVPIAISSQLAKEASSSSSLAVQNEMPSSMQTDVQMHQQQFHTTKERKQSFVGFDYADQDRRVSSQFSPKNTHKKKLHQNDQEMIPPHLLTTEDETEAMFGSVPRPSVRNRPIE